MAGVQMRVRRRLPASAVQVWVSTISVVASLKSPHRGPTNEGRERRGKTQHLAPRPNTGLGSLIHASARPLSRHCHGPLILLSILHRSSAPPPLLPTKRPLSPPAPPSSSTSPSPTRRAAIRWHRPIFHLGVGQGRMRYAAAARVGGGDASNEERGPDKAYQPHWASLSPARVRVTGSLAKTDIEGIEVEFRLRITDHVGVGSHTWSPLYCGSTLASPAPAHIPGSAPPKTSMSTSGSRSWSRPFVAMLALVTTVGARADAGGAGGGSSGSMTAETQSGRRH